MCLRANKYIIYFVCNAYVFSRQINTICVWGEGTDCAQSMVDICVKPPLKKNRRKTYTKGKRCNSLHLCNFTCGVFFEYTSLNIIQ